MSKRIQLREKPWYGDTDFTIDLPDSWDVHVCQMRGADAPALTDAQIQKAFVNPIGSKTIKELAKGKKEVVIIFDDMARPTPSAQLVPYILAELAAAGIPDDNIRFVGAPGSHGTMNAEDFAKKLGDDVVGRFLVFNHNPYENLTYLGETSRGTPVYINSEVMSCDLKIAIGCIVPHPLSGFGGGGKIILPGVAGIETIHVNHSTFAPSPLCGIGECRNNPFKQDVDETARMAGLDIKIDAILNMKREICGLFVGDVSAEHDEGIKTAREHYATDMVTDADIVIANCYMKANEIILAPLIAAPVLKASGGDMVIIYNTPEGQIPMFWTRSWGKNMGGRGWYARQRLPPNTKRLTVMTPHPERAGVDCMAPARLVSWRKTWPEVLEELKQTYGTKAKVVVLPDVTVQYFPGVPAGKPIGVKH
jgi:nickel-dependent lactate racemase